MKEIRHKKLSSLFYYILAYLITKRMGIKRIDFRIEDKEHVAVIYVYPLRETKEVIQQKIEELTECEKNQRDWHKMYRP